MQLIWVNPRTFTQPTGDLIGIPRTFLMNRIGIDMMLAVAVRGRSRMAHLVTEYGGIAQMHSFHGWQRKRRGQQRQRVRGPFRAKPNIVPDIPMPILPVSGSRFLRTAHSMTEK